MTGARPFNVPFVAKGNGVGDVERLSAMESVPCLHCHENRRLLQISFIFTGVLAIMTVTSLTFSVITRNECQDFRDRTLVDLLNMVNKGDIGPTDTRDKEIVNDDVTNEIDYTIANFYEDFQLAPPKVASGVVIETDNIGDSPDRSHLVRRSASDNSRVRRDERATRMAEEGDPQDQRRRHRSAKQSNQERNKKRKSKKGSKVQMKKLKAEIEEMKTLINQSQKTPVVHLFADVQISRDAQSRLKSNENESVPYYVKGEMVGRMYHQGFVSNNKTYSFWKSEFPYATDTFRTTTQYVEVRKSGIYLIYAQVSYLETMRRLSFSVARHRLPEQGLGHGEQSILLDCHSGIDHVGKHRNDDDASPTTGNSQDSKDWESLAARANFRSCSSTRVVTLLKGDRLILMDHYTRYVRANSQETFWGVVQLGKLLGAL